MRSCLFCRGISNVSRKMRFLATSSVTRHLLTSMKDERGTCYGFTRLSAEVTSRTALFNRAFTNLSTSWCRTICSSCVVFSEHNLNSSPKIANSNNATKLKCNSHNGLGQARQGGLERPVQETMRAKKEKKENIKTIPNMLTALRMASAPLLGYLVIYESFWWALSIFVCAGVTDLLDGFIARNFANQTSALGSVMDPLADKFLVSILTVSLTCVGLIPLPLTLLIVSRDLALIVGGFYIRYRSLHPPITLSRYFDISHATAKVNPTFISKVNTGLQLTLVASSLAAPVFGFVDHALLQALWYATGTTTFASGIDYMWSWKKYVTLLEKDQTEL